MQKDEKERVVAELTERLRVAETLIVADYRGLTMPQIDTLRGRLVEHGAKFTVVKNTLTRRAAEAAGVDALPALLEGPSAIAFIESGGDMVAVAKAMADSARETRVLEIRGGLMQGRVISAADVDELAKLPPVETLRGQVLGAIIAPLTELLALVNAPLQNLVGLIDARIEQLGGPDAAPAPSAEPEGTAEPAAPAGEVESEPGARASAEAPADEPEPAGESDAAPVPTASAEPEAAAEPAADAEAEPAAPAAGEAQSEPGASASAEAPAGEPEPDSESEPGSESDPDQEA